MIGLGLLGTGSMVAFWGAAGIGETVDRALPALPASIAVHATQLLLSALGWRCIMRRPRPAVWVVARLRWVREAVNTMLPFAGVGGGLAAGRMLARELGYASGDAAASVTADITVEATAQVPFLLLSIAAAIALAPGRVAPMHALLAVLPLLLGVAGFIAAQRAGLAQLIERTASRFGAGARIAGWHSALLALHAKRARLARAFLFHFASWSLGGAEVWIILRATGHPVGPGAAVAIEGLGMAVRSTGFVLPAGLAAQEAGFALAVAAFGIPVATGLALSMVKRMREVAVCLAGLLAWRFGERGRQVAPAG